MKDKSKTIKLILNEIEGLGILEALGDGISIQDTNYRVVYQNKIHKSFIGEHTGEFCYKAYENREQVCDGCPVAMAFKDGKSHTEERSIPTDRGIAYFEITASSLKDIKGKIIAGIEIARDITENKKAEETLRENQDKYSKLFHYSNDAIFIHDLEGNILDANKKASKLFGYSLSDLKGMKIQELHPQESIKISKNAFETILKNNFVQFEVDFKRKDGSIVNAEVSSSLYQIEAKKVIQGSIRNITQRKKAAMEREYLFGELSQKNKELEQLLYATSHDLRSPLVNIGGYNKEITTSLEEVVSILQNEEDVTIAKEKISFIVASDIAESEHYISKNVIKMNNLLSGLLNLSRLGRQELKKEKLNMSKMISDIAESMTYQVNDIGAILELSEVPLCTGDAMQMNQLFSNLIGNALKYLDAERSGIIRVSGRKEHDHSVYCVEDNGIGISPKHQEKIFEIFYQLEPAKTEGEGLGLTIASRIVNSHRGKIWVESELGKGSKFFVSLPA